MDLELEHSNLTSYTLYIDKTKTVEGRCNKKIKMPIVYGNIECWINPIEKNWGVVPIIRINGFLINTYLANITVYDHMFQFVFDRDFFVNYSKRSLKSLFDHIPKEKLNDKLYLDTHFSIENANTELVAEIKSILNEKISTNNDS